MGSLCSLHTQEEQFQQLIALQRTCLYSYCYNKDMNVLLLPRTFLHSALLEARGQQCTSHHFHSPLRESTRQKSTFSNSEKDMKPESKNAFVLLLPQLDVSLIT